MKLHFTREEFDARARRVLSAMHRDRLDALLLFNPESHFWLTGYDTFGYCFFQCLVLAADGRTTLLTRSADLRQARLTSLVADIRVWADGADAAPAAELIRLLGELGLGAKRLGVEWASKGLDAAHGRALAAGLDERATLVDASHLVARFRLVKSPDELVYLRRAAKLGDEALRAALATAGPGADEAAIQAALTAAVLAGGGDAMANPPIVGSGAYALLCRAHTGRRRLDTEDQLTLEWAGVCRHYHAAQMRTICIGRPTRRHVELFDAAHEALAACETRLRPGYALGDVYAAHAQVLDGAGLGEHRLNACGYAMGAVFAPSWMDWPMCHARNPVLLEADMVFFLHMILMDSETGTAMTLGRTSRVTDGAPEHLSGYPLELLVR